MWLRWGMLIGILGLLVCMSALLFAQMQGPPEPIQAASGPVVPDFTLPDTTGKAVRFSGFTAGRPSVILFGTTACPYCNMQIEELKQLQRRAGDRVAILEINVGEAPQKVAEHIARVRSPFTTLVDRTGELYSRYGTGAVPVTLVADGQRRILQQGSVIPASRLAELLGLAPKG